LGYILGGDYCVIKFLLKQLISSLAVEFIAVIGAGTDNLGEPLNKSSFLVLLI